MKHGIVFTFLDVLFIVPLGKFYFVHFFIVVFKVNRMFSLFVF